MPTDPTGAVTDAIGSFLATPGVQTAIRLAVLGSVVAWGVTLGWAYRDATARSRNPLLALGAGAVVFAATPLGFPLAIVLWMLVRPRQTVAEIEEQQLTIAALENEAHGDLCPGCRLRTNPEWRRCPRCRTWLRAVCPRCERNVDFDASICPWCTYDLPPGSLRPDPDPSRRDLVPVMALRTDAAAAQPPFPPVLPEPASMTDGGRGVHGRAGPPGAPEHASRAAGRTAGQ
jgi:hypothetical protein